MLICIHSTHHTPLYSHLKQINVFPVKALQWLKILPLLVFMEMHRMARIKSISARMLTPWEVVRTI